MASQTPRPPPKNLLFCVPPPSLPHIVLFPSSDVYNLNDKILTEDIPHKNLDINSLNDINNVGVPVCDHYYSDYVDCEVYKPSNTDECGKLSAYFRRAQSFDSSYIHGFDGFEDLVQICRLSRSESVHSKTFYDKDDSAYNLNGNAPPHIILNNPFYENSYPIDQSQINNLIPSFPENYLAFEDSFVPAWNYRPDLVNGVLVQNNSVYCQPVCLVSDPWCAYPNNEPRVLYPQAPTNVDHMNFIPINTMFMPPPFVHNIQDHHLIRAVEDPSFNYIGNHLVATDIHIPKVIENDSTVKSSVLVSDPSVVTTDTSAVTTDTSAVTSDEEKNESRDSNSGDSTNDVSCGVTSSLAFIPCSTSSQTAHDSDDTTDDTSPCSTDYQEASALDIVQSTDEFSCCDSTDYSQSRDDVSPLIPDVKPKEIEIFNDIENDKPVNTNDDLKTLNELLPLISHSESFTNKLETQVGVGSFENISSSQTNSLNSNCNNLDKKPTSPENLNCEITDSLLKESIPSPPAVPASWFTNAVKSNYECNQKPQIFIKESSPPESSVLNSASTTKAAENPQPSCSFVPPAQVEQLKPEGQSKEVEVRFPYYVLLHLHDSLHLLTNRKLYFIRY